MIMQNMSMTKSIFSSNFTSPDVKFSPRFQSVFVLPTCHLPIQKYGDGSLFVGSRSLQYFSSNKIAQNNSKIKRTLVVYSNLPSGDPLPFGGALPGSWKGWLLGMLFTVVIPLATNKWGTILKWTNKIGSTIQTIENVVEAVEDVAEKVEKITEDMIDDLPEGKLKNAVTFIENAAEKIAKDAHLVDNIIDKAQEAEEKFEAFIEENREACKEGNVKIEEKFEAFKEENKEAPKEAKVRIEEKFEVFVEENKETAKEAKVNKDI